MIDPLIRVFFENDNMRNGFVFIQGFYENGRFYIHEIGYRLNGGFSYKIIEFYSKYNQIAELIKYSLTGRMSLNEIAKSNPWFDGYGMIVTISLKPGTIQSIHGVEEIASTKGVLSFYQLHDIGETLSSHGTTAQVFAYILCAFDKKGGLEKIVETIKLLLTILDSEGNNMINEIINVKKIVFGRQ